MIQKNKSLALVVFFLLSLNFLFAQDLQKEITFSKHHWLPGYGFKKVNHPEIFQGNRKKKKYFEGWYFKLVSADGSSILSIIPGIALSEDGKEKHAFIQIIDGKTAKTNYFSFPIEEFKFSRKEFAIRIGQNYFSADKIILNILTDSSAVSGTINISHQSKLRSRTLLKPGIMGWYKYVPFMECYHGVVNLNSQLDGTITKDAKAYNFNNGAGYVEKDWGSSMPSAWIWMQSNSFGNSKSSFMLSVANVPWLGKSFTGFLGFLLHDSVVYRFATYTHARLTLEPSGADTIKINIRDRKHSYKIVAYRNKSGLLKAPVKGSMDRRIPESVDARLLLNVFDKKGKLILSDSTTIAGLELVGDQGSLKK